MGAPYIIQMLDKFAKSVDVELSASSTNAISNKAVTDALKNKRNYRTAVVGQSSSTTTNPYYKFASISIPAVNSDAAISFKVSQNYNDSSTHMGILTAHARTDGNAYWQDSEFVWEYALAGITPADFILVHNTSVKPTVIELWVKVTTQWVSYHFDVISEGTRVSSSNELWTLYNKVSAGSEAALPTDMVSQTSTLGTLKNSISAMNGHTVNSDVPANAKFTDTTYPKVSDTIDGIMTKEDKKKLSGIEENAQENVIESITVNGVSATPKNKNIDLTIGDDNKLPLTGGEVTGNVQQSGPTTDYGTFKFRNIAFGTSATPPTDTTFGGNGSIYFYY